MASEAPSPGRVRRSAARFFKFAGIGMAAVAVIGAGCAAFMSSRYFTAAVEAELARTMLESKQRTLKFDGALEIFFWPEAGFSVGRVSLSEPGSAKEFASVDSARFAVAAAPLFNGRIVVDDCTVDGLKAAIVKHRDGTLNVADLLASEKPSSSSFVLDVVGIRVGRSTLSWTDEASGTITTASALELSGSRLQADAKAKTLRADSLSLAGSVDAIQLRLALAGLAASPAALAAERAALDIAYKAGDTAVSASLGARLAADPEHGTAAFEDLTGGIDIAHPRLARPLKFPLHGALHAGRDAADGNLSTRFDESNAVLKFKLSDYSPPALRFDIDIDRLDVGRYLSPRPAERAQEKQDSIDLSALKALRLDGTARIGSLQIAGVRTSNIKLEIRGAQGKLAVQGVGGAAAR